MVAISNCEPRECGWQEDVSPTLKARDYKDPKILQNQGQLRRLTPKECFRLMGFLNDEINLEGLSDTQRYKLAGNGQDVNMVSLIFKEMFK
jgi:DNA (cytosine-5)-methyltransferase 1